MTPTLSAEIVRSIVCNLHQRPHAILGCHSYKERWVVRAYLPDSHGQTKLELHDPATGQSVPMTSSHDPQFWEVVLPTKPQLYQLRRDGTAFYDPYDFRESLLSDFDRHVFAEGNHYQIYEKLGAHPAEFRGVKGIFFAVWAPNARNVSVIGDFNNWDGRCHQLQKCNPGVWEIFIPELDIGTAYKYEIKNEWGHIYEKSDPYGFQQEIRPKTASIITDLDSYQWHDREWLEQRKSRDPLAHPVSVYEVHLGSWMHGSFDEPPTEYPAVGAADLKPGARFLTYRELADKLIPYVKNLGFTHLELLPIAEHPFDGSWGYQVTGYYAATSRYGTPQDLMYFIDVCHQQGIGVIVDWVPAHFPKDGHGLAFFDGTHLYEHADSRIGEHKEWGTLIFNYERNEVRNFLIANALFWFDKYHIDGIRVDAVASMLYLDYNREAGEWLPNRYGGRENLGAIELFRHLHSILFSKFPGVLSIAEESTSYPMITWPAYAGGLGFNLKWNMGWMHDMLDYFAMDPWFRQFHQNMVTFSIMYAFSENFMLALSHDEVVHGKSPMLGKVPGDEWQKFAHLRCLYGYMFTHPGKKTLFMGMEFGTWSEWNVWGDLEWHLLQYPVHQGLQKFIADLNSLLCQQAPLHQIDNSWDGFQWIDCNDNHNSVVSFIRRAKDGSYLVVACNFTPVTHFSYRIGVPEQVFYQEILNSDSTIYGGSGQGNLGGKQADAWGCHGQPYSLDLCLPPLGVLILMPKLK